MISYTQELAKLRIHLKENTNSSFHDYLNCKGLFTQSDCNFDLFITTNGLHRIQYKFSHGVIGAMTLNPVQLINCDEQIAVAITPCEQPIKSTHTLMST